MKAVYYLFLCFFSSLSTILAYPVDYDESSVNTTRQALDDLHTLLGYNFGDIHQEFSHDDVAEVMKNVYAKINSTYNAFSSYMEQIQKIAESVNANITNCEEYYPLIAYEPVMASVSESCTNPITNIASVYRGLEENKRGYSFIEKHNELSNFFESCLDPEEPEPYVCAGVVASTLQEVQRLLPEVKVQHVQFQRELEPKIWILVECANNVVTTYIDSLQIWHYSFGTCVKDMINRP